MIFLHFIIIPFKWGQSLADIFSIGSSSKSLRRIRVFFAVNALFSRTVLLLGPTFLRFIFTSTWISWSVLISIFFYSLIHSYLQDVHQKLCFFPIHCNQSPACRRAIHPQKRSECTVTLVGWPIFCTTNSSLVLAMER